MLDMIAFDADDTLWHNESRYLEAKDRFKQLLSTYHSPGWGENRLDETEIQNIRSYGYGIKSFTLSMIETAIELTDGQITARDIEEILGLGKRMLEAEVQLFEHVEETLAKLARDYPLMLITKGDLFEQQRKIERSGLAQYFRHIEVVGEKTGASYRVLLEKHHVEPHRFLMVGNSMRSDILPVLEIGGRAVYIPYQHTWLHEQVSTDETQQHEYVELEDLGQLPELVARLGKQ
jgi:putative hydrolase of the HAD superfamily